MPSVTDKHVLIIGGGTAGITVAAEFVHRCGAQAPAISIVEPSDMHYYQPAFTLVGAGAFNMAKTARPEKSLIPSGVQWVQDRAAGFHPDSNKVMLESGASVSYDYLVVCPGVELDWDRIAGARQALGRDGVCSNYSPDFAEYTWNSMQNLKPGARALFTQPPMPIKCPGAPQKIAYLAAHYLQKRDILGKCELHFLTQAPSMFSVPLFAGELEKVAARYGIHVHFQHNLVGVNSTTRSASFEVVDGDRKGETLDMEFDLLHITPPQRPPEAIRSSPLANEAGWVDVDKGNLRHARYANVFALGDACSTPNSKTAAAVRKQAPVVVQNLLALLEGRQPEVTYDGYASCPITTAYGKVIMAEFIYGGKVTPTFPLDPRKERRFNWWIKATGLPLFYWHYMLKGRERFLKHNTDFVEPAS